MLLCWSLCVDFPILGVCPFLISEFKSCFRRCIFKILVSGFIVWCFGGVPQYLPLYIYWVFFSSLLYYFQIILMSFPIIFLTYFPLYNFYCSNGIFSDRHLISYLFNWSFSFYFWLFTKFRELYLVFASSCNVCVIFSVFCSFTNFDFCKKKKIDCFWKFFVCGYIFLLCLIFLVKILLC